MITAISMDMQEWEDTYNPMSNHIDFKASWNGALYETYGEEEKFIYEVDPRHVWTYMDGDDGGTYLVSGRSFINRIGYIVTAKPWDEDDIIEVKVIEADEEGEE